MSTKLANRMYGDMEGGGATSEDVTNGHSRRNGKATRKRQAKSHTRPRDVSEQQILDLIRAKGPLRVAQMMEITGLTQSAAHKKVAALREQGAIKQVQEGTHVHYVVNRGANSARKTARKKARRKAGKRASRGKSTVAKKTTAAPASASA